MSTKRCKKVHLSPCGALSSSSSRPSQQQCLYSILLVLGLCSELAGFEQRQFTQQQQQRRHPSTAAAAAAAATTATASLQQQRLPLYGNASIVLPTG